MDERKFGNGIPPVTPQENSNSVDQESISGRMERHLNIEGYIYCYYSDGGLLIIRPISDLDIKVINHSHPKGDEAVHTEFKSIYHDGRQKFVLQLDKSKPWPETFEVRGMGGVHAIIDRKGKVIENNFHNGDANFRPERINPEVYRNACIELDLLADKK